MLSGCEHRRIYGAVPVSRAGYGLLPVTTFTCWRALLLLPIGPKVHQEPADASGSGEDKRSGERTEQQTRRKRKSSPGEEAQRLEAAGVALQVCNASDGPQGKGLERR